MKTYSINLMTVALALTIWSVSASGADESSARSALNLSVPTTYEFKQDEPAGLYRKKLSSNFRIRGWEVADSLYLGQAKVGDKWGFGMVFQKGDTAYGINHRGVQMLKRF